MFKKILHTILQLAKVFSLVYVVYELFALFFPVL